MMNLPNISNSGTFGKLVQWIRVITHPTGVHDGSKESLKEHMELGRNLIKDF